MIHLGGLTNHQNKAVQISSFHSEFCFSDENQKFRVIKYPLDLHHSCDLTHDWLPVSVSFEFNVLLPYCFYKIGDQSCIQDVLIRKRVGEVEWILHFVYIEKWSRYEVSTCRGEWKRELMLLILKYLKQFYNKSTST